MANNSRILYVDPNNLDDDPITNVPINNEDLSIFVELTTSKKSRSVIKDGTQFNEGGVDTKINFISGSQSGPNECDRSLTTSYTDINTSFQKSDDLEGFGITAIDISFDTAYTPLVKIKFIDVRGGMMSQGNDSKYGVFFELPYPIFSLTIKGYYGPAVNYCLHLVKWNANFNSQTGNFEIDAEFIGYTYAMLTDLLIGYMRAIPLTSIGGDVFKEVKGEYDKKTGDISNGNALVTVNDMLTTIDTLIAQLPTIKNDSDSFNKIKDIDKDIKILKQIKGKHGNFIRLLKQAGAGDNKLQGDDTYSVILSKEGVGNLIKNRNNDIKALISDLNDEGSINDYYDKIIITDKLEYDKVKDLNEDSKKYLYSASTSNSTEYVENEPRVTEILKKISTPKDPDKYKNGFLVYDYIRFINSVNDHLSTMDVSRKEKLQEFSNDVRELSKTKYNFDPTIKNIFRILTGGAETYLRSINTVSTQAENSPDRTSELSKLISSSALNVKPSSVIYGFPEYNEDGVEKWLGSAVDENKVIEVKFVNQLLEGLIESQRQSNELKQNLNSNSDWYCVGPVDTPVANEATKLVQNPYRNLIGASEHPDSVMRLLMYRMYTYLGFGTSLVTDDTIKYMAKFEANNMFYGVIKKDTRAVIQENFNTKDKILTHYQEGSDQIPNWTGKPKDSDFRKVPYIVNHAGGLWKYDYISKPPTEENNDNYGARQYIPINNNYDGKIFRTNNGISRLKSADELKSSVLLEGKLLYISNFINGNTPVYSGGTSDASLEKLDDGARYLEIIKLADYTSYKFSLPNENTQTVKDSYRESIPEDKPIEQKVIADRNKELDKIDPLKTKFYVPYFDKDVKAGGVNDDEDIKDVEGTNDISQVFYSKTEKGTRLSLLNIEDGKLSNFGQNMRLYSQSLKGDDVIITKPEFNLSTKVRWLSGIENERIYAKTSNADDFDINTLSLFSSAFYYAQNATVSNTILCQGYLFLNTLPLRGIVGDYDNSSVFDTLFDSSGQYGTQTIRNDEHRSSATLQGLFAKTSAFIKTPSLWIAWVGSILWRYEYYVNKNEDPIVTRGFLSGSTVSPLLDVDTYPTPFELWNNTEEGWFTSETGKPPMYLANTDEKTIYKKVDRTLLGLPESVKTEFMSFFIGWCEKNFEEFKSKAQIFNDDIVPETNDGVAVFDTWQLSWDTVKALTPKKAGNPTSHLIDSNFSGFTASNGQLVGYNGTTEINTGILINPSCEGNIINLYPAILSTQPQLSWYVYNQAVTDTLLRTYKRLINDVSVIANNTPNIWRRRDIKYKREPFTIYDNKMSLFLESFTEEYKRLYDESADKSKDSGGIKNGLFNTQNNEFIKLNIYRHLSTIRNKWLGEVDSNSSMFYPCGYDEDSTLFSRFKFLDKAFNDIGDDFILNPKVISGLINKTSNQSFYDLISNILANNNFNFIALPTFVDFTTEGGLKNIFKPKSYVDMVTNDNNTTIGPSFICTYVGQTSEHLDVNDSDFPDDAISLNPNCATFTDNKLYSKSSVNNIPVFEVNYGQQNQSYFKDINLDQREFVETSESLIIIDELSRTGKDNKAPFQSQNLFNVYQTRSYSAEIEAMGMPLIQPMMYFQLNNIPMFRGAYLILSTSHNIKPNHMTTKFKGVRIKDVNTPLNKEVLALKDLSLTETGDADSLRYNVDTNSGNKSNVAGNSNMYLGDYESIYWYNYKGTIKKYAFANSEFDKPSNTKKNGVFMTYNEIFDEVGKLTGTDPIILKVFSVIESRVGQDKGKAPGMNGLGYVGVFQFGVLASKDVYSKLNDYIFNKMPDLSSYEFSASVDTTNKTVLIPNEQSTNATINNVTKNSFFDDYINSIAAILLAQRNIGTVLGTDPETIRDIYFAHQQGRGGAKTILNNVLTDINDGSKTSGNMLGNKPSIKPDDIILTNYGSWIAGWSGVVDKIYEEITGTYTPSLIDSPHPNADNLRKTIESLGYTEKGGELSSGGDISADMEKYASAIFTKIHQLYPDYGIEVAAGNDKFHQTPASASRHKNGDAIDFVIKGPNKVKIRKPNDWKSAKTNPPATYSTSDGVIINNIIKVIQGYVVTNLSNLSYLDEYREPSKPASGPHIHLSYRDGGGTEGVKFIAQSEAQLNAGNVIKYYV